MMYFDDISIIKDAPESSCVHIYCNECGEIDFIELDKFTELKNSQYVILKEGISLKCESCGKTHEGRKVQYKERPNTNHVNIPRCPVCGSMKLEKIKTSSKVMAGALIGVFAMPYTNKTFTCKDCGYKF